MTSTPLRLQNQHFPSIAFDLLIEFLSLETQDLHAGIDDRSLCDMQFSQRLWRCLCFPTSQMLANSLVVAKHPGHLLLEVCCMLKRPML
jgi:hypothetical protein